MLRRSHAIALGSLAVLLGVAALALFFRASAQPGRPSFEGALSVVTNAPNDEVQLFADVVEADDAEPAVLHLHVLVADQWNRTADELWVAVGLLDEALPAIRGGSVADGPMAAADFVAPESKDFAVAGLDPAYFVTKTSWPSNDGESSTGAVVFGRVVTPSVADGKDFVLAVPLTGDLVRDVGASWTVSTPHFGGGHVPEPPGNPEVYLESMNEGVAHEQLEAINTAANGGWHLPARSTFTFELAEDLVSDSVQQSGTPPVEPFGNEWRSSAPFRVDAVFTRPDQVARQARQQFFAGVLVSLAGGFFVWAMEIWLSGRRAADYHPHRSEHRSA